MLAQQKQSRWTSFVERLDGRLEGFRESIDPFSRSQNSQGQGRRMKPWAVVALSVGLVVLAVGIGFGGWWIYDHHKWALLWPLFKVGKLVAIGVAIVAAILFGGKLAKNPEVEQAQNGDVAGSKG